MVMVFSLKHLLHLYHKMRLIQTLIRISSWGLSKLRFIRILGRGRLVKTKIQGITIMLLLMLYRHLLIKNRHLNLCHLGELFRQKNVLSQAQLVTPAIKITNKQSKNNKLPIYHVPVTSNNQAQPKDNICMARKPARTSKQCFFKSKVFTM